MIPKPHEIFLTILIMIALLGLLEIKYQDSDDSDPSMNAKTHWDHKIHVKTSGEMTPNEKIIYLYAEE